MYLSRLILNPRSRRVLSELAAPYEMHRTLSRCFGPALTDGKERFLFRVDEDRQGRATLLLQSRSEPSWDWLEEPGARGYLLPLPDNPACKEVDLRLAAGQVLAFRLRANPTRKRWTEAGDRKRTGLYEEAEQEAWLARKGSYAGFELLSLRIGADEMVTGAIHRREDNVTHRAKLLAVTFEGVLRVRDPALLQDAVLAGIGSGKAFGLGLLSLAPAG